MNAKTIKTAKASPASAALASAAAPWNFFADFSRQQMSVAADASCAMFRGFEAIRKIQQQAAHTAAQRHEAVAERLHANCAPADLMAIQSELLAGDFKNATQYWQDLAATAMEMQTEIMGCTSHLVDSEAALEAVSAMEHLEGLPGMSTFFAKKMNGTAARPRAS
jgi:hypothetical protein